MTLVPRPPMKARVKKLCASLLALALLLPPAGALANDCAGAVALLDDVARLIANQEADGWFSDTEAFRDLDEPMLESVCHASPEARALPACRCQRSPEK